MSGPSKIQEARSEKLPSRASRQVPADDMLSPTELESLRHEARETSDFAKQAFAKRAAVYKARQGGNE